MKEARSENTRAGSAAAGTAGWQDYYAPSRERLALGDDDVNAVIAEQIDAIESEAAGLPIANCPPNPPDGFPDATSQRFYYLSEIVGDIPAGSPECGAALACFLSQIVAAQINPAGNPVQVHSNATLVVDRHCQVRQTLTLPNRFTLAGVGPDGEGSLSFVDLPDGASALRFALATDPAIRTVTIRDIRLSGEGSCCGQVGINVSNSQFVYVDRVRMSGFAFGVSGEAAYSIFVSDSSFHGNAFSLMMGADTTAWRVRDSVMSHGLIGVIMAATARGHVISGARIEGNDVTGVLVNGAMNLIESSWFEGNGTLPPAAPTLHGIRITTLAQKTRVLGNLFSSQLIRDVGAETRRCFNMSFASMSGDVNQIECR